MSVSIEDLNLQQLADVKKQLDDVCHYLLLSSAVGVIDALAIISRNYRTLRIHLPN